MKISIPKPCNENWNEMTPEQQGAFCKVCSKVVVDFSNMSDDEVIKYLEKKKGEKTCGRFLVSQLSPYELKINLRSVAAQRSFPKIFVASLFIFFSSLFVCKSDTGEAMMFNVVPVDTMDTSSFVLRADSVSNTLDTTAIIQTDSAEIFPIIMGGISAPPVLVEVDTPVIVKDTMVEPPKMVGEIEVQRPMIMGKMVCTKPNQVNKPKPVERKTKGEVRIMGDLKL
jgi:hypothetical protein